MAEPTILMAIFSGIGSIFFALVALIAIIWFLAEEYRVKKYPTRNQYAYGHNDCNVQFITGGDYRK